MPSYTLYYFNGRGRAEICRMLFAVASVQYQDKRIELAEWTQFKTKMPCHMLPILEIDTETQVPQSMAISRYLAREFGFYGKNNMDMFKVDCLCDSLFELFNDYMAVYNEKDAAKKTELQKRFQNTCLRVLPYMEKTLEANKGGAGWFIGDQILLCDMMTHAALENPIQENANLLKEYPKLAALRTRVAAHPKIAAYIKKRNNTAF
uniref:S-crystallin SL11 n=2 Tax=Coleoidea TaxID=6606 RepID=SCR11_NOTSL|nr:RecName: Full=S-crystallin SL11; AltName: Full=Major lens polypeptide [Nototodarus sloanii]AAA63411.1 major lens polypeptide [Nototodarus sloanii]